MAWLDGNAIPVRVNLQALELAERSWRRSRSIEMVKHKCKLSGKRSNKLRKLGS
jgi:hypothetical protein